MKKLVPALCLLLISALLLGTSTYAWFSMNTQVTATGMAVIARAEDGLVISNAASGTYDQRAASVKSTAAELYPGSTADLSNWWHSVSTNPAAANTQQDYTEGTAWVANSGTYGNYVVHDFYIRSSAASALTVASLDVKTLTVTPTGALQNLSPTLRVGIKFAGDSNAYIYAPVTGADTACTVQPGTPSGSTPVAYVGTGRINVSEATAPTASTVTSIPANSQAGTHVEVFVWYEGEDASCISNNIEASLQQLDVEIVFGYTAA
jgi:hypothetical protein